MPETIYDIGEGNWDCNPGNTLSPGFIIQFGKLRTKKWPQNYSSETTGKSGRWWRQKTRMKVE